jgi:hypothetical protein
MPIKRVTIRVDVPDVEATDEQIEEWLCCEIGQYSDISFENPLQGMRLSDSDNWLQEIN